MSDSLAERVLKLRMRPDLVVRERFVDRRPVCVVKDPVSLQYSQLREEEYFILRQLDSTTSLAEIKRRFDRRFAPRCLPIERLHAFVGSLHENGLLLAEASGQGDQLLQRFGRQRKSSLLRQWSNILAVRFRGVDPQRFLEWLDPKCRFLFTPQAQAAFVLLVVAALLLLAARYDALSAKLPGFGEFFSGRNIIWLAGTLAVVKVLHELGHGLTCRHFGGECHEIGIMFLVFTPCLYCNVTDAWMLPNRWHRIAISAAGIYVEVGLAAVCTFLWAFSEPGLLNSLFLNVMFICSVSTVLFNGNPLLRFDGYYMLSDLVEIPNLNQASRALLRRWLVKIALGVDLSADPSLADRKRGFLYAYAVASIAYRCLVVVVILWFCYRVARQHDLEFFGLALAGLVLLPMIVAPVINVAAALRHPRLGRKTPRSRALMSATVLAALLGFVCFVPLPYRVAAPLVVEPCGAKHVFVSAPGQLVEAVESGDRVAQGQPLVRLVDARLRLELERLKGQRDQQQQFLDTLRILRASDPQAGAAIPAAVETLDEFEKRLETLEAECERLTLRAPQSGVVIPPPRRAARAETGELRAWCGTPLDARNRGCFLEAGALVCLVGDAERVEAVLAVDQADVEYVRPGQEVKIRLDQRPGEVLRGTVIDIAKSQLNVSPRDSTLAERRGTDGDRTTAQTLYQARVSLKPEGDSPLIGASGLAKVLADPQPLARRLIRFLAGAFNFDV